MSFDDNSFSFADVDSESYFIPTNTESRESAQIRVVVSESESDHRRSTELSVPVEETTSDLVSASSDEWLVQGKSHYQSRLSVNQAGTLNASLFAIVGEIDSLGNNSHLSHFPPTENVIRVAHGKKLREIAHQLISASDSSETSTDNISSEERWTDSSSNASKNEDEIEIENMMHKVGNPPKPLSYSVHLFPRAIAKRSARGRSQNSDHYPSSSPHRIRLEPKNNLAVGMWRGRQLPDQPNLRTTTGQETSEEVCDFHSDISLQGDHIWINEKSRHEENVRAFLPPRGHHVNITNMSTLTSDGLGSIQSNLQLENVDYLSVIEVASDNRDLSTIESITSNEARDVFCRRAATQESNQTSEDHYDGESLSNEENGEVESDEGGLEIHNNSEEENLQHAAASARKGTKEASHCQRIVACKNPLEALFLSLIAASTATLIILLVLLVQRNS